MTRLRLPTLALVGITILLTGSAPAEAQFYGGIGYGSPNGFNATGYASGAYPTNNWYVSPYGAISSGYVGTFGNGFGYTRNYGMMPMGFGTGYGSPYVASPPGFVSNYGYSSSYYGIGAPGYGTSYGLGAYSPGVVGPGPVYGTTTTIIRGGPTGGVINYSNNGNGYTYSPESSYPTVIQQQPTLGLSRTYVPPSLPPTLIESRPPGAATGSFISPSQQPSSRGAGIIKLVCPKSAAGLLTYSLNGHAYTIQPGYSQSFRDDRAWTIEFHRGGDGSEVARHSLRAGTYNFGVGTNGWELTQASTASTAVIPPAPVSAPMPDSLPTLSPGPTPLPPP